MPIRSLHVAGYRSIRKLWLRMQDTNLIVGPNGCGKSNLYRSMYLLSQAAQGRLAQAVGAEGGMPSVLWAGPRGRGPVRMKLGLRTDEFAFDLTCGLPPPAGTLFIVDPEVKEERIASIVSGREIVMLKRRQALAQLRDDEGRMQQPSGAGRA